MVPLPLRLVVAGLAAVLTAVVLTAPVTCLLATGALSVAALLVAALVLAALVMATLFVAALRLSTLARLLAVARRGLALVGPLLALLALPVPAVPARLDLLLAGPERLLGLADLVELRLQPLVGLRVTLWWFLTHDETRADRALVRRLCSNPDKPPRPFPRRRRERSHKPSLPRPPGRSPRVHGRIPSAVSSP